jgi:hypothetical protein
MQSNPIDLKLPEFECRMPSPPKMPDLVPSAPADSKNVRRPPSDDELLQEMMDVNSNINWDSGFSSNR